MLYLNEEPIRRGPFYLEDYHSSLGASLGATEEAASITNPLNSIMRMRELSRAERGVEPNILDYNLFGDQAPSTASPMTDAASARQKIKDEGLNLTVPDAGIRSRALDILIERKKAERQREDILNRAPTGIGPATARFGVNLATSAMDPLNIASAFIPVIGEARYAAMLGRAGGLVGRTGVRASVGAAEGAVGAAVVEPLVYGAAQREQADYDLTDSIINITVGTAVGGGLHVGAGAIGDAVNAGRDWRTARAAPDAPIPRMMEAAPPSVREAALRTGVSQAIDGRELNIEPVVSYASRQGVEEPPLRASVGPAELPRVDAVTGVEGFTVYHGSPHSFDRFDSSKIGTGEGAQAYGHGIYLAEARGVAKDYQTQLSTARISHPDLGENLGFMRLDTTFANAAKKASPSIDMTKAEEIGTQVSEGLRQGDDIAHMRKFVAKSDWSAAEKDAWIGALDHAAEFRVEKNPGALYEARILAHPDDFLDWDKPLSERSAKVREALRPFVDELHRGALKYGPADRTVFENITGEDLHEESSVKRDPSGLADLLRERGIPGIKYLDQGSRVDPNEIKTWQQAVAQYEAQGDTAKLAVAKRSLADIERRQKEGSRNFVIFDDKLIHPIRRNDEFIAKQPQDLRATATASFAPEQMRLYDGEAVRIADERIANAPDDETMPEVSLQEAMEDVTRLANELGDPEIVGREMADVNELEDTAAAYGRGVLAAALCRTRRI